MAGRRGRGAPQEGEDPYEIWYEGGSAAEAVVDAEALELELLLTPEERLDYHEGMGLAGKNRGEL